MVENLHLAAPHIYMLIFCTQQNVSCLFVDDSVTMLRGCQDQDSRHEWQKANRRAKRSLSPEKKREEDGKDREQYLDRCSKFSLKEKVMQFFVCFFAKSLTRQMQLNNDQCFIFAYLLVLYLNIIQSNNLIECDIQCVSLFGSGGKAQQ